MDNVNNHWILALLNHRVRTISKVKKKGLTYTALVVTIILMFLTSGVLFDTEDIDAAKKDAPSATGSCGDQIKWAYDADNRKLTISGMGEMDDYYVNDRMNYSPWHNYTENYDTYQYHLDTVEFKGSITSIGQGSFVSCTIGNLIMCDSITKIGDNAFAYSTIDNISLSNNISTIGTKAFYLSTINNGFTIPGTLKTVGLLAFDEIKLPEILQIEEGIKNINFDFSFCKGVKTIILPSTLETIETGAFNYCRDLVTLDLSKCVNLKTMNSCIYETSITELTIPAADLIEIRSDSIKKLTLNGSVNDLIIDGCPNLTTINVTEQSGLIVDDEIIYTKDMSEIVFYPGSKTDSEYTIPDTIKKAHISNSYIQHNFPK